MYTHRAFDSARDYIYKHAAARRERERNEVSTVRLIIDCARSGGEENIMSDCRERVCVFVRVYLLYIRMCVCVRVCV